MRVSRPSPYSRRPGFAAVAAVLALVTIGLVGAIAVLPLIEVATEQARVEQTHNYLVRLTDVEKRGMQKFVELLVSPPSQMVHLSTAPGNVAGACGVNYTDPGEWEPLSDRVFVASGVPTPIGIISNHLVRVGNEVMVEIAGVRLADAERLDMLADDTPDGAAGRVRWIVTDAAQELVALRWVTPFTC
jgi:hypothetical protein